MMFVDANVFMYAVGREHEFKRPSQDFFDRSVMEEIQLATSAEVLQELIHAYVSVNRHNELASAMSLLPEYDIAVWPLEEEDVVLAWQLSTEHPHLSARDLCHLASCRRRGVREVMTFDQALRRAFGVI